MLEMIIIAGVLCIFGYAYYKSTVKRARSIVDKILDEKDGKNIFIKKNERTV